jgi:integrase
MCILDEILTLEHESEHDLSQKKQYSNPKIYTAGGDLSKRWYVYFSFRNPATGKLQRVKNIYGKANTFKNKEDRLYMLTTYRKNLLKLLKQGYNPFEDNTELYQKHTSAVEKSKQPVAPPKKVAPSIELKKEEKLSSPAKSMGVLEAFDYALSLKEKLVSPRTLKDYRYKGEHFIKWLGKAYPDISTMGQLNKRVLQEFLNSILIRTSARNRNNYRVDLSSLFQTLEDNDIIPSNFIKKIPVLKSNPKRNKTYTSQRQEEIFAYLEEKDPTLLLFIKFISYNFLRPIEVCRLRIKDIDLTNKVIRFKAKNSPLKTKIIPQLLIDELPDLSGYDSEAFLFTSEGLGMHCDTTETNRRNYFSKRFKKVVKKHFNLGKNYGLYSFRHTYITKLYRSLVKNSSPHVAKSNLMLITGHSSMGALEKYLRDIDAELPEDYSQMLR